MQSASYAYADFVEFVRNVAAVRIFEIEGHDARFGVASVDGRADVFERIYNVFRYSIDMFFDFCKVVESPFCALMKGAYAA